MNKVNQIMQVRKYKDTRLMITATGVVMEIFLIAGSRTEAAGSANSV